MCSAFPHGVVLVKHGSHLYVTQLAGVFCVKVAREQKPRRTQDMGTLSIECGAPEVMVPQDCVT